MSELFSNVFVADINLFVFLDQSLVPSYFEGTDFPYVVVKNPYDKSLLTVDPSVCKNYTLGLICKFVPGKGIEEFVRVSNERHDQFNFVLAGGPSEPRDPYGKNILKSLDYDRINYLGYLDDVSKFYSKADFLLFSTSYSSEAFPGVVVESMAAGVVPIVKRHNSLVAVFSGAPIVWFSTPEELSIRLNDIYKWDFDTLISKSQCCKKWITNNLTDVNGWSVQLDSIIEDVLFTD